MESFNGLYQEWPGSVKQSISVVLLEKELQIGFLGSTTRVRWKLKDIRLSISVDGLRTEIRHATLPSFLELEGRFAYDRIGLWKDRTSLPWHRRPRGREWLRNSVLLVALVLTVLLAYNKIVPFLSEKLAATISVESERTLGDGVYEVLASDYRVDSIRSRLVADFFESMKVPTAYSLRFSVVESSELNAFALPGGRIVVYGALLDSMRSAAELAALLSHEFIHVNQKHATRSIFRQLGSQVFLGLVFGNLGTVGSVLVENANQLRTLTYSRELEREADLKGLNIIVERGIDPGGFEGLFSRLKSVKSAEVPEFMASHPDLDNRIAYIKEMSKQASVKPQPDLDAIFAELKR